MLDSPIVPRHLFFFLTFSLIYRETFKESWSSDNIVLAIMATRLFASTVAVLLAIIAIYYQELLDTFYLTPKLEVVDSVRDITYLGSLSLAGIEHFQNIFYAEAPTGLRRFAAPVPTRPVKGSVIDATKAGAWCPQGTGDILPFTSSVTNISENCLSLRIARPSGIQKDAKLPVAVWIHGGESTVCNGRERRRA